MFVLTDVQLACAEESSYRNKYESNMPRYTNSVYMYRLSEFKDVNEYWESEIKRLNSGSLEITSKSCPQSQSLAYKTNRIIRSRINYECCFEAMQRANLIIILYKEGKEVYRTMPYKNGDMNEILNAIY